MPCSASVGPSGELMSIVLPFDVPFRRPSVAPNPPSLGPPTAKPFPLSIELKMAYSRFAASDPNSLANELVS